MAGDESPEDEAAKEVGKRASFVLAGFKSHLSDLKTAICRGRGRMRESFMDGERLEREVETYFVLDAPGRRVRFERKDSNVRTTVNGALKATKPDDSVIFLTTPEYTLDRASGGISDLFIDPAGKKMPNAIDPIIDPRTVAYCAFSNLSTPYDQMIRSTEFDFSKAVEVEIDVAETYRVRADIGGDIEISMWFDASRAFVPIRTEIRYEPVAPGRIILDTQTGYRQYGELWLPESCRLVDTSGQERSLELALEWERVNEPIPDAAFTWEGLDLAEGTHIVDVRLGDSHPVIVATVKRAEPSMVLKPPVGSRSRLFLLIGNVVAVIAIFAFAIYRRLRKRPCP